MVELFKGLIKDNPPKLPPEIEEDNPEEEEVIVEEESPPEEGDGYDEEYEKPDELSMLKKRADIMGVKYSNNIKLDTLKARIKEKQAETTKAEDQSYDPAVEEAVQQSIYEEKVRASAVPIGSMDQDFNKRRKNETIREFLQRTCMRLVRVRITNLDPKKKDLPGEILTVANKYLGTVKKYIPYGEVTDNGYHIPYVLYEQLLSRKFLSIKTRKGYRGQEVVEHQWVREFAIDVLPPLTTAELAKLAAAQQAAGGLME